MNGMWTRTHTSFHLAKLRKTAPKIHGHRNWRNGPKTAFFDMGSRLYSVALKASFAQPLRRMPELHAPAGARPAPKSHSRGSIPPL